MQSRWSDASAREAVAAFTANDAPCNEDLALRTYSARLIGADPALVLSGGGNTSVKTRLPDETGELIDVICIKGSGWDLATIEPAGHPTVRLDTLAALRRLDKLDDQAMVRAARVRLLDPGAPTPSVELLLHAFLPHRFIDHSHADAILALVDQDDAERICEDVFGDRVAFVPYIMPGFALAKLAADVYERNPHVEGLVLHRHGLFTFGDSARDSYERHIALVSAAEQRVPARSTSQYAGRHERGAPDWSRLGPILRGALDAGGRCVLHLRATDPIRSFVDDPALDSLARRGPATPDHVLRTKPFPLILRVDGGDDDNVRAAVAHALEQYRSTYDSYFDRCHAAKPAQRTRLDPDPRIILVPGLGLVAAARSEREAMEAADIYEHTIDVIRGAEAVGRYAPLGESDLFDMEYWVLEQAKLGRRVDRALESQVVYVTGAASGIGAAIARRFAEAGAHLFLVDRDARVAELACQLRAGHAVIDVTDADAVERSVDAAVARFGGLDGVVSNAGVASQAPMRDCPPDELMRSFAVNFFAHQWVAAATLRVLRRQGTGGFLLFNASKAAIDPGPSFGAYATAKAALIALMRQYALEEAGADIRTGAINADRIRTSLLSTDDVERRARARGLPVEEYYRSNLLRREVTASDVADAFLHLALARSTTGLVITVDGGNVAALPR